jgi:hypothetical protein
MDTTVGGVDNRVDTDDADDVIGDNDDINGRRKALCRPKINTIMSRISDRRTPPPHLRRR